MFSKADDEQVTGFDFIKSEDLKLIACEYLDDLSVTNNSEFNAGQARGIQIMLQWIDKLNKEV